MDVANPGAQKRSTSFSGPYNFPGVSILMSTEFSAVSRSLGEPRHPMAGVPAGPLSGGGDFPSVTNALWANDGSGKLYGFPQKKTPYNDLNKPNKASKPLKTVKSRKIVLQNFPTDNCSTVKISFPPPVSPGRGFPALGSSPRSICHPFQYWLLAGVVQHGSAPAF